MQQISQENLQKETPDERSLFYSLRTAFKCIFKTFISLRSQQGHITYKNFVNGVNSGKARKTVRISGSKQIKSFYAVSIFGCSFSTEMRMSPCELNMKWICSRLYCSIKVENRWRPPHGAGETYNPAAGIKSWMCISSKVTRSTGSHNNQQDGGARQGSGFHLSPQLLPFGWRCRWLRTAVSNLV